MSIERRRERALVKALKNRPWFMDARLRELKKERAGLNRRDFVWHYMLQSFGTMGSRKGWERLGGSVELYGRVCFARLRSLEPAKRRQELRAVFKAAALRRWKKKADWASRNFQVIESAGGVERFSRGARESNGRDAKIAYLKQLYGIGDKYARNIWMDVYHEEFRSSVAIDTQIGKVTAALGHDFDEYKAHESYYCRLAKKVQVQPWELDRLLFNFTDYFLWAIDSVQSRGPPKSR